jgi:glyoxylase-like metal-dependent hydrolase (beta-lactamase superfamily II)
MSLPIADRWFEFEHISDAITRIWEPHVIRLMQCNIWHVRGRDRDLLVDTGFGVASLHAAARHTFNKPLSAVATHAHVDHVGSLHEFPERIIHRAEAHELDVRSEPFSLRREDHPREVIDMFERAGYEVGPTFVSALPCPAFNLTEFGRPAAPATRLVEGGDVMRLMSLYKRSGMCALATVAMNRFSGLNLLLSR